MKELHISAAPHIHSGVGTGNIMLDVVIAMVPAAIVGVMLFGVQALLVLATCVVSAVVGEAIFNLCVHKKQTVKDCSAVVTGLLLGLNLSTNVPLWQCAVGALFAIVVVKGLFGGLGKNIVNPAIAARVLMLLTFGAVGGGANPVRFVELESSATPLAALNTGVDGLSAAPSLKDLFLGLHGGAIGETCAAALLIGFVYLVVRKVIKWYVPVSFMGTVFVCYLVFTGDPTYALAQVLAGGLVLGAVFMATDYVTTPTTGAGRVLFCVGAGLITFAIRQFGSYPEGVSISILVMNLFTPFLEQWTAKKTLGGIK